MRLQPTMLAPRLLGGTLLLSHLQGSFANEQVTGHAPISDHTHQRRQLQEPTWSDITPSKELQWVPCYSTGFECARLVVPMDYDNPDNNQTVIIALTRLLATDRDDYRGSVLVNPGGPGLSGIESVWTLSELLGPRIGTNYDVVGWDIRGSWRSTPTTNCWANIQRRAIWRERYREHWQWPGMSDDPAFIGLLLSQVKLEKSACKDLLGPTGILEHVNTGYHAKDMNSIREALGEDKLNYWGVSWGTALGGYFASMFPDKVGRLVLDANIDIRKWSRGEHSSLHGDFAMVLDYFFETCAQDNRCAFHEPTAAAVKERYETLMDDIRMYPRVFNPWSMGTWVPVLTTYSLANVIVENTLRGPLQAFPILAEWLARWEANNDTTSEHLALGSEDAYPEFSNTVPWDADDPDYAIGYDGQVSRLESEEITNCADWPVQPTDPNELQTLLDESPSPRPAAMLEVGRKIWCAGSVRPKWRYTGPFGTNTSTPILFINAWDSVTPLASAHRNAQIFPGSRVVEVASYGHVIAASSQCVVDHMFSYFQNGTMPASHVTCNDLPELHYGDDWVAPPPIGSSMPSSSRRRDWNGRLPPRFNPGL